MTRGSEPNLLVNPHSTVGRVVALMLLAGCLRAPQAVPPTLVSTPGAPATCPPRSAGAPSVSSSRAVRLDGPSFVVGDRVVVVVDDTVRGITTVAAAPRQGPIQFADEQVLAGLRPEEIATLTVIPRAELPRWAAPCEVEGGIAIRTTRSSGRQ